MKTKLGDLITDAYSIDALSKDVKRPFVTYGSSKSFDQYDELL